MIKIKGFIFSLLILGVISSPIDNCPKLPAHKPKDINDLSPSDISVVMALGDSITAAFGALGRDGLLEEYRGLSGPIGGDTDAVTVANFFRHYNPNVIGASVGEHIAELPGEGHYTNDVLNAAQSGATTADFNGQVNYLIDTLKSNPNVSMSNDWKFINILIGANDACPLCWDWNRPSPSQAADVYEKNIRAAIQQIHDNIPRTLVNILPLFNVSGVYNLSLGRAYCRDFHDVIPFECPCAFDSDDQNRLYLDTVITEYGKRVFQIAQDWQSKKLPDFNVIYQPFTYYLELTDLPITYLSDLDCFHPSLIAHQKIAIASWNSLIVPFAQKPKKFDPSTPLKCATESSRLFTN